LIFDDIARDLQQRLRIVILTTFAGFEPNSKMDARCAAQFLQV